MKRNENIIIISESTNETVEIGYEFSKILKKGDFVAINGDLGSGKTHFVKGIAKGLNISEEISSPTFTLVNEYLGKIKLIHFDVYRFENVEHLYDIGFEDYFDDEAIIVMEWAELVKQAIPNKHFEVSISKCDENEEKRKIMIKFVEQE